jgi:hypothetical protein
MDLKAIATQVIEYGITFGLVTSTIFLIVCSLIVQDTAYIRRDPKFFVAETLTMGVLSSLPIILIAHLRGHDIAESATSAVTLCLHVAFVHVGFQLSGIYSELFPKSAASAR